MCPPTVVDVHHELVSLLRSARAACSRPRARRSRKSTSNRRPEKRAEMQARSGRRTVPQIFIGDHHVGGSDDLHALEDAGKLDAMLGR